MTTIYQILHPRSFTHKLLPLVAAYSLLSLPLAQATDFSWDLAGHGDWSDAGNWAPAGGPPDGAGDGAFLNTGSGVSNPLREITVDGDFQLGEMRVGFIDGVSAWGNIRLLASGPSSSIILDDGTDTAQLSIGSNNLNFAGRGILTLGNDTSISTVGGGAYIGSLNPALRGGGTNQGELDGQLTLESGAAVNIGTAIAPTQLLVGVSIHDNSTQQTVNGSFIAAAGSAVNINSTDLLVGSNGTRRTINSGSEPRGRFGTLNLQDADVQVFEVENSFIIGRNSRHYLFGLNANEGSGSHGVVNLAHVNGSVGGNLWVGDFYQGETTQTDSSGLLTLNNATLTVAGDVDIWETGVVDVTLNGAPSGIILSSGSALDLVPENGYNILFNDMDGYTGIYYGLAWAGDNVAFLDALAGDSKITWVNNAGGLVDIFYDSNSDFTYIAVIPEARTLFFLIAPVLLIVLRGIRRSTSTKL